MEAASLAGHLQLHKLIVFYDDNATTIDGKTDLAFSEDIGASFAAKGWNVLRIPDGNLYDSAVYEKAVQDAKAAADVNVAPEEVKAEKKPEKKTKKEESAGISKAERDELEKLKQSIIELKTQLKNEGMTGGQINKDPEIVAWVARMTELKIKEDPTLADGDKKKDEKKEKKKPASEEKLALEKRMEEYRTQLKTEFGYTEKDIKADPDYADMQKQLSKLK